MPLFDRILAARGIDPASRAAFLNPEYNSGHDAYLLPDMDRAIKRLMSALKKQEKITIYGDYDIDGLTSTALLADVFEAIGFMDVEQFIPSRFVEGFGVTADAIRRLAKNGTKLIITVDCGSQSVEEVDLANKLGVDMIITDHHEPAKKLPPAVAVINPKRTDSKYPFKDLAGVGVAFKLAQALQKKINDDSTNPSINSGLPSGQEKWLLDLVALGTVCDVVNLTDENRVFVYYGLKVLAKTKRPGLKALMAVSRVEPDELNARALGFGLGPRLNAAGRLETARYALETLVEKDPMIALAKAEMLESMNKTRRSEQDDIMLGATAQAEKYAKDSVLVLADAIWNHGIVGIVASKIMEKFQKPAFVIQELDKQSKGSARSYGDFDVVSAIRDAKGLISKGGGHKLAGGITLPTKNIAKFREVVNKSYKDQGLELHAQKKLLLPHADATAKIDEITEKLVEQISQLEPFGIGNPQPTIRADNLMVKKIRKMGDLDQHLKLELADEFGNSMTFVSFGVFDKFDMCIGDSLSVWFYPRINFWQNRKSIEGYIVHLEQTSQ